MAADPGTFWIVVYGPDNTNQPTLGQISPPVLYDWYYDGSAWKICLDDDFSSLKSDLIVSALGFNDYTVTSNDMSGGGYYTITMTQNTPKEFSQFSDGTNIYTVKDSEARTVLSGKQDTLVSGTNIKTINNQSILGEGNLTISSVDSLFNQNTNSGAINPLKIWNGTEQQWEQGESVIWYNWEYTSGGSGSWTAETSGVSTTLSGVTYGNNKFITVGGATILSSSDGSTWTKETSSIYITLNNVTYGNNKFIAVGNDGAIMSSSDGSTWTSEVSGVLDTLYGVTYGNNKFIAVGIGGTILSSSNGSTWTAETSGVSAYLYGVTYVNNKFIAVGLSGTILSSSDGSTWTAETSGVSTTLNGVTYGNNKFIVVGSNGTILSSSDGSTWTAETSGISVTLRGVTYGNNKFIAVGNNGAIISSSDGSTWTTETSGVSTTLSGVTYGNNKFIVVGNSGTILSKVSGGQTLSCFTTESSPTTSSQVYSAPNTSSALTITSVGTGTITLSDTNTYNYNASGNETTYTTIGELHSNWICNINNVGVKIGNTTIATTGGGSSGSYTAGTGIDITNNIISVDNTIATIASLSTVATSGSYNDLSNKPTIPTVNNATLTITQGGISKGTFTANADSDVTIALDTGTTYSAFTGADGTNAGTSGLVPAPSATDNTKFLKGDGTWATVSGGGSSYTAGDGIDITNNVISVDGQTTSSIDTEAVSEIDTELVDEVTLATVATTGSFSDLTGTSGVQMTSNLVTSVSSSSTDTQYPSAKLFYDTVGDIETLINAL